MIFYRKKKSDYYWKQYIRLKKIYDDLLDSGFPIEYKLNSTLWELLGKYCDSLLKEIK